MRRKHIFLLPLLGLAILLNTSCRFEEEEFFDQSASLRVTSTNDELKSRLVSQSSDGNYGWVIQYFVAGTDDYDFEGFNLFGKFYDSNKVTLAGNHRYLRNGQAGQYTEASSVYEIKPEEGTLLSFNTWNDVLSVFADPVSPSSAPQNLVSDGEGMNGDYNMVLHKMTDDEIVFRGQRHQAEIRFVKCDRPWTDYMQDVSTLKDRVSNGTVTSYYVTDGVHTRYFSNLRTGVITYGERIDDPLDKQTLTSLFTAKGFRLGKVASLGGNTFQEFTLDEANGCLVSENGAVKVIPCWDSYMTTHAAVFKFDASLFSAEQQSLYSQIDAEVKKYNSTWSVESIGIGQSSGSNKVSGLVITFYTNAAKTKTNTAGLAMTTTNPAYGQYKIEAVAADKVDRNMETITKKAGQLEALTRQFAATLNGTYSVVPNDYFLPTGGDFTAIDGGTTFKLQ